MPDKKPTPFTLIICTEGVNHSLQFRSSATATAAYRQLRELVNKKTPCYQDVTDDYGACVSVDCLHVRSLRLTDVAQEHRANMGMKLCELYAALEFEELVKTEHAALTIIKARNNTGGIIRPPQ